MEPRIYDRLVAAEWLEQVKETESKLQKGVYEMASTWLTVKQPLEYTEIKIIIFSKMYRELLKSGPLSHEELNLIVGMGREFAILKGIENC
jgi:hypothetical protein